MSCWRSSSTRRFPTRTWALIRGEASAWSGCGPRSPQLSRGCPAITGTWPPWNVVLVPAAIHSGGAVGGAVRRRHRGDRAADRGGDPARAERDRAPQRARRRADRFVPTRWRGYLDEARQDGDAVGYRHYWELCVLLGAARRAALRGRVRARLAPLRRPGRLPAHPAPWAAAAATSSAVWSASPPTPATCSGRG